MATGVHRSTAEVPVLEGRRIRPRTQQFILYSLRDGRRSPTSLLTRTVELGEQDGTNIIRVVQRYESARGVSVDSSVMHAGTLAPLSYRSHLTTQVEAFDFSPTQAIGTITPLDSTGAVRRVEQPLPEPVYNAVVLEELIGTLPLRPGPQMRLPAYNPGRQLLNLTVQVTGHEALRLPGGGRLDCWIVTMTGGGGPATFWISQRTRELIRSRTVLPDGSEFWRVRLHADPV
jgi:hypothetical protein